ncbi:peptidoglycan recognition protein family protein [Enterococcus dispar]|uniref:peptidoglycan recognition protein family protein n=1 Tax=Enterococcus dispar TaxID=44009 RepID=UPI00288F2C02|nr:N-acetylmuramoyl-L-alanine amidase [Enterococcus dispar]MDT2705774.1 N-acetylmuramoyl-L-alanine amidase [Enterococcus dispar]
MVVSYSGIAGRRGYNPTKIVIHNDGGSQNAKASFYRSWLEDHNPELGYAHYYVAEDGTYQAESDGNCAWHCANSIGNRDYLGIEVCQSLGNQKTFLANEQKAFQLAAQLCRKYGLKAEYSIFPLHRELSSTDCPSRAWVEHGKAIAAVRNYYVQQVKKYMTGGNTVAVKNTRARHYIHTFWYTKNSSGHKAVVKYCKDHKWSYKEYYSKDKKSVKIVIGTFGQNSTNKFDMEKWLGNKNYHYIVTTDAK